MKTPLHPGEILLKNFLEPLGISQRQLALHLGWSYARLNEIINLHRGITADSALSLAESLGTTPEYWLMLQLHWDLWHAQKTHVRVKPFAVHQK
ncbi:MAG: HigA family addiction module antidote protein [Legionellales bacterium]|nr:HigA family addiction module antidote protein [Legionellales bacterium]